MSTTPQQPAKQPPTQEYIDARLTVSYSDASKPLDEAAQRAVLYLLRDGIDWLTYDDCNAIANTVRGSIRGPGFEYVPGLPLRSLAQKLHQAAAALVIGAEFVEPPEREDEFVSAYELADAAYDLLEYQL